MNSNNSNFASQVLAELKQDILNGEFEPGEKLLMSKLKERYAVGISPLREALSQLLVEELVILENQRGFRVSPISIEDLEDIYQARAQIEVLCVGMAIDKGDDNWEANIIAAAHKLNKYVSGKEIDIDTWQQRHLDFHSAIAVGCGSHQLMQVRKFLYDKAARYRNLWLKENISHSEMLKINQQEHIQLQQMVIKRDKKTALDLIQRHLKTPVEIIKNTFLLIKSV